MVEQLKELLSWMTRLLPTQKVRGDHAMQIGKVHGRVHVDRSTHHHTQHHNHVTIIQAHSCATVYPAHPAQPTPQSAPRTAAQPVVIDRPPNVAAPGACSATLSRMNLLRDRTRVLDFMEREFGTRMVIQLTSEQLYRLDRYLDVVLSDRRNLKVIRKRQ